MRGPRGTRSIGSRWPWLALFTALLLVSSAVPVLADSISSPEEVAVASEEEAEKLPDAGDIAKGLSDLEEFEAEERQQRETPRAEEERLASTDAYADLSPSQAEGLLQEKFAEQLALVDQDPGRALSDAHLDQVLGPNAARVTVGGDTMLVEGTIPVTAAGDGGDPAKVNLDLEPSQEGYVPKNPLTEVTLPENASQPVGLGSEGFAIAPTLSEPASPARPLDGEEVMYFETQKDTDLIVSPLAAGVELFSLLRSAQSPEELRFQLTLPAGAELRSDGNGGAEVVREADRLIRIPAPLAFDAQGAEVPVTMGAEGDSLVLTIAHREMDVAYPLLVDPQAVSENWYENGNDWYHYGNLWALEQGTSSWYLNTNSAGRFLASTTPIYSKPGLSERGLFISAKSTASSQPANQMGEWTLRVPGADSYFAAALINPFWRWDNGCAYQSYPEPHDYSGLWNDYWGWATFHSDWARTYGYGIETPFEQLKGTPNEWRVYTGQVLIIGMGTGNGAGSIPCWRDLYAGGVMLWMDDASQPVLTTSSTGQWMDKVPVRLNVSANDTGLGVRKFEAEATDQSGGTRIWDTWNSCTGGYAAPCPPSWNLAYAGQPQLSYDPAVLPEGIRTLNVTAYDAVLRKSTTTNGMTVRIDHAPPAITFSGTLTEQGTIGTERPSYAIRAEAKDGVPGSENQSDARSGATGIVFKNDGQVVSEYSPGCATQSCSLFREIKVPASEMTPGAHVLAVTATDALGHSETKSLTFTTGDKKSPALSTNGLPEESSALPKRATYWSSFGTGGTSGGQFSHPSDIAIDASGNLWVVDELNNRVQKFDQAGKFLAKFGSSGSGNGQLSRPTSLAIDAKGNIWVADAGNGRVQQFNEKGEFLTKFGSKGTGNGQFAGAGPEGIAIDAKGNIWVSDTYGGRVQKFTDKGEFRQVVSSKGSGVGQLGEPTGIDVAANGDVWVADWQNNRVSVFDEVGKFIRQFGASGTGNGQFARPDAIAVGAKGDVWVGDQNNGRVQEFNQSGEYVAQFGSKGTGKGQFSFGYPMGLATDSRGSIWITDTNNNRIQRWLLPTTPANGYPEPITTAATDNGFGVTALAAKLTDEALSTEVLGERTQSCKDGACSLDLNLDEVDLSEKPSGTYLLEITATDGAGNTRSASRVLSLDTAPPELDLSGTLAESADEPLNLTSADLQIDAKDLDSSSFGGVRTINVERDDQLVASYPSDCSGDCRDVDASYTYRSAEDGADRSITSVSETGEGTAGELTSVSCVTTSACWAVGRTRYTAAEEAKGKTAAPLLERWDGNSWQELAVLKPEGATDVYLEGIACKSTSSCLAVGYYIDSSGYRHPLSERWNGTKWTTPLTPLPSGASKGSLYDVSCSSTNTCWARGRTQVSAFEQSEGKSPVSYLLRWNTLIWQTATAAPKPEGASDLYLEGISCGSTSACLAVGYSTDASGKRTPLAERWDGTKWAASSPPLPSGVSRGGLKGISCSSASACWAYGENQLTSIETEEGKVPTPYFEHWDGSAWQTTATPKTPAGGAAVLSGISCVSESACTAVGRHDNGHAETVPLAYTWNGSEWRFQPAPAPTEATDTSLEGVSCTSANECAMVGYSRAESGKWMALTETESPGQDAHQITVEAVDTQGNSKSETIEIDVDPSSVAPPECNAEPDLETAKGVLTPAQAVDSIEETLPAAVAPSEGATAPSTEEVIDPSYSAPSPNLETVDSLAEGETSVTPEGGFTLDDAICASPAVLTPATSDATVVNKDAALFANTGSETDTVIRPTAMGATVIQALRGPDAPDSFAWNVAVLPGQELVELPSGDVAVVEVGSEVEEVAQVPSEPKKSPADIADVGVQVENGEYALINAEDETQLEVVAVIARPWVVLAQGGIVPALIEVVPDTETPNEFELIVHAPLTEEEEAVWPAHLVTDMAGISSVGGGCSKEDSPCGHLDLDKMAQYAVYWGKEEHHGARKPFYADYGANNCTNFTSQILRAGGAKFMRAFHHGDGSWWYRNYSSGGVFGDGPSGGWDDTESWRLADKLPRHLWRYELAYIDSVQQPWGWTKGDILAYDWIDSDGKGQVNHLNFVVGTQDLLGGREPLFANSSSQGSNYPNKPWSRVKERIEAEHGSQWNRFALAAKHRVANLEAKRRDPDNLYGSNGLFHE